MYPQRHHSEDEQLVATILAGMSMTRAASQGNQHAVNSTQYGHDAATRSASPCLGSNLHVPAAHTAPYAAGISAWDQQMQLRYNRQEPLLAATGAQPPSWYSPLPPPTFPHSTAFTTAPSALDQLGITKKEDATRAAHHNMSPADQMSAAHLYNPSTGRFDEPERRPRRLGLPRPDRRNPGQWLYISRETQPGAFRSPDEQSKSQNFLNPTAAQSRPAAAQRAGTGSGVTRRMTRSQRGGGLRGAPRHALDPGAPAFEVTPHLARLIAENERRQERRDTKQECDRSMADAIRQGVSIAAGPTPEGSDQEEDHSEDEEPPTSLEDNAWKVGETHTQPLQYTVAADNQGGTKVKTIAFTVDFTDPKSVTKANKARSLAIWRANKKFGLEDQLRRQSTVGRQYTRENDDFILAAHEAYGTSNSGRRMSFPELERAYNQRFPGEDRSQASLASHIDQRAHLKAKRQSFSK